MTHPYITYVEKGLNNYVHHAFTGKRKYIDYLFKLKCAGDLISTGVFPNAKEITESFAAFIAIKKYFRHLNLEDPNVVVHVVADGSTPRTGALLAFLTKWKIYSIDPQMNDKWLSCENYDIDRLACYKDKVESICNYLPVSNIVLLVHPHIDYPTIRSCYPTTPLIVIPCCVAYPRDKANVLYTDHGIWSPKNEVLIYK